jgi:hypothetical protein
VDIDPHRGDDRHQERLRTSVWCRVTPRKIRTTNGTQKFFGSITIMENVHNHQQSSEPQEFSGTQLRSMSTEALGRQSY